MLNQFDFLFNATEIAMAWHGLAFHIDRVELPGKQTFTKFEEKKTSCETGEGEKKKQ